MTAQGLRKIIAQGNAGMIVRVILFHWQLPGLIRKGSGWMFLPKALSTSSEIIDL